MDSNQRIARAVAERIMQQVQWRAAESLGRIFTEEDKRYLLPAILAAIAEAQAELVAAIRLALAHVQELRDAWSRGALSEHDGRGGTRSNRNIEVEKALRAALSSPDTTGENAAKRGRRK